MTTSTHGAYEIDDDPGRLDLDVIHRYLSKESYWAAGRPREVVEESIIASARVVGAYRNGAQVGFARVVTDGVAIAYLADVFVLPEHRSSGLGKAIVRAAVDDGPFAGVRWVLHTADAHSLYARFGFGLPTERLMERSRAG